MLCRAQIAFIAVLTMLALSACSSGNKSISAMPQVATLNGIASQCQPDFALATNKKSATITGGQSVLVVVGMTSVCGLAGSINVGVTRISPHPTSNGPTLNQSRYDIPLPANGSAGVNIRFGATSATLKTTYTITIRGEDISGGCCYGRTHLTTFTLTVK